MRDGKRKGKESATALVARQQERELRTKKKWEQQRQLKAQEEKYYTNRKRATKIDEHSARLLIKKKLMERKLEHEHPTAITQVYTTNLMKQANITEDNPLYAVQRIYETAEKTKRQNQFIHEKIFAR